MNRYQLWAEDTGIRAIKTFAQALGALVTGDAFNVITATWQADLGLAAGAAVICVLHNVTKLPNPAAVGKK